MTAAKRLEVPPVAGGVCGNGWVRLASKHLSFAAPMLTIAAAPPVQAKVVANPCDHGGHLMLHMGGTSRATPVRVHQLQIPSRNRTSRPVEVTKGLDAALNAALLRSATLIELL